MTKVITNSEGKPHFATLDGLRGIAALSVVILHWFDGLGFNLFGTSLLAVDFFFMLSGFVVAYSYEERLKKGFPFGKFMLLRVIRLMPMIVLGAFLGLVRFEAKYFLDFHHLSIQYILQFIATSFMIPSNLNDINSMFPLNLALWSLFYEFCAYILYGSIFFRLSKKWFALIIFLSTIGLLVWLNSSFGGNKNSFNAPAFVDGFSRVLFSFLIGVLLFRNYKILMQFGKKIPIFTIILLPLLFIIPREIFPYYIYFLGLIIISPLMIIVGLGNKFEGMAAKIINLLGDVSYPIYAIHTPIIWSLGFLIKKLGFTDTNQIIWFGLLVIPLNILISYLSLKLYDEPVRKYLKSKFNSYLKA